MTRGRVPPHNVDAEAAVIGAALLGPDGLAAVRAVGLSPEDFFKPAHQFMFDAVVRLSEGGDPVDAVTVADELRRAGVLDDVGGVEAVTGLLVDTPSIGGAAKYGRIVRETATTRRVIGVAGELAEAAYDERPTGELLELLERSVGALRTRTNGTAGRHWPALNWHDLFARDRSGPDWLVEDFWPRGRMISLTAPRKERKSLLMLYLAACLAVGRCPWTARKVDPVVVAYLDLEMTEDDLLERIEDMGFGPDDLSGLRYFLRPGLPLLDTPEGGRALLQLLDANEPEALIIDTFGRVISGEDYTGADVRAFYRWSAEHVKARGISVARLDHTGHNNATRAKGSAEKGADVDVGWVLSKGDDGTLRLEHHGLTRLSWVSDRIDLVMTQDPLTFRRALRSWPAGTAEVARQLEDLGLPLDVSGNVAQQALRAAGKGRNRSLSWRPSHTAGSRIHELPARWDGTTFGTTRNYPLGLQ
jgi:hypothetical protein